jgi:hypothetical protein
MGKIKGVCMKNWLLWLMFLLIFIAIIVVVILARWYAGFSDNEFLSLITKPLTRETYGTVGDFFGGILGPTFSFLGLIMLLATLYQNQIELGLTRQEMELTRGELADSKKALQAQVDTADKQRFENTFFALLEQHNVLLRVILEGRTNYFSRDGVPRAAVSISAALFEAIFGRSYIYTFNKFQASLSNAKKVILADDPLVSQYFRVLFQLLKFVRNSEQDNKVLATADEKFYTNIIRSFLTRDVYALLAVNASIEDGNDIYALYHELIVRYQFLEHMRFNEIENQDLLRELLAHYDKQAFGDNSGYRQFLAEQQGSVHE